MSEKIISGIVSDYRAEEKYDPDGNQYIHYQFSLNEIPLFCKTGKEFNIYNQHHIIVKVKDGSVPMEVMGMYNTTRQSSFGKTSGLKALQPATQYKLIKSSLKEKQRNYTRVHNTNYNNVQRYLSFTLLLENGLELHANTRTGKKIMPGHELFIYKPADTNGVSEFFNVTTGSSSKPSSLLAYGLFVLLLASLSGIAWSWKLPWSEKAFIVAVGGISALTGLIGTWSEWNTYVFRKKRYREFIERIAAEKK